MVPALHHFSSIPQSEASPELTTLRKRKWLQVRHFCVISASLELLPDTERGGSNNLEILGTKPHMGCQPVVLQSCPCSQCGCREKHHRTVLPQPEPGCGSAERSKFSFARLEGTSYRPKSLLRVEPQGSKLQNQVLEHLQHSSLCRGDPA